MSVLAVNTMRGTLAFLSLPAGNVRCLSLWSRVKSVAKTLLGNKEETPRQIQERHDVNISILAATHLSLRKATRDDNLESTELIDQAVEIMEQHGLQNKGLLGLRYELQTVLEPHVLDLFEAFAKADRRLEASKSTKDYDFDITLKTILRNDFVDALSHKNSANSTEEAFWNRKQGALHTILVHQGWTEGGGAQQNEANKNAEDGALNDSFLDDFGYNASQAKTVDVVNEIRRHQTLNLCRSALIKKEVDYSVVALKSTIPGAGRGIFCDGHAMAGSILAFFPGQVWPKEHLLNLSLATQQHFEHDPNYQLSLRYDEVCIDSRKSPYTVLSANLDNEEGSNNPWALGHVCNHPPPSGKPNCRTVPINFTQPMKLTGSNLMQYVPNSYAREPMMLGPQALDREVVVMHGLGLQAIRDVENEELFYDYRLSPGSSEEYPKWYHVVDEDELRNRWDSDSKSK